jgi:hypothetical protein
VAWILAARAAEPSVGLVIKVENEHQKQEHLRLPWLLKGSCRDHVGAG